MNARIFWMALMLLTQACRQVETLEIRNDAGTLEESFGKDKKTGHLEGKRTLYAPAGKIQLEENYCQGKLEGQRKLYNAAGRLQILETYQNGLFHGPYFAYHENGKVAAEGLYVRNEMSGPWKYSDALGRLKEVVFFARNNENGYFREFYPNGNLSAKGCYRNGDAEQGELLEYDSTGALVRQAYCFNGSCFTFWKRDTL